MVALLDNALGPEQAAGVRARVAASPHAAAEFADLREFRDQMAVQPPRVHGPAPSAAQPAPGKVVAFPAWARVALAAAAVVLLGAAWWRFEPRPASQGAGSLLAGADLGALPTDLRRSVEKAARTGRPERAALPPELRPSAGTLAGEASAPTMLEQIGPVGTMVRANRPTLRWKGRADATGYVIYLGTDGAGEPQFHEEVPADRTEWTPPTPLTSGLAYEWQVEARHDHEVIDRVPRPPAPESRFEVLGEADIARLQKIESLAGGNPLVLGTAYNRAGLRQEAVEQYRELARQHPESAMAARLWCESKKDPNDRAESPSQKRRRSVKCSSKPLCACPSPCFPAAADACGCWSRRFARWRPTRHPRPFLPPRPARPSRRCPTNSSPPPTTPRATPCWPPRRRTSRMAKPCARFSTTITARLFIPATLPAPPRLPFTRAVSTN